MADREMIYIAQFYLFVALNFSVDSGHLHQEIFQALILALLMRAWHNWTMFKAMQELYQLVTNVVSHWQDVPKCDVCGKILVGNIDVLIMSSQGAISGFHIALWLLGYI